MPVLMHDARMRAIDSGHADALVSSRYVGAQLIGTEFLRRCGRCRLVVPAHSQG